MGNSVVLSGDRKNIIEIITLLLDFMQSPNND